MELHLRPEMERRIRIVAESQGRSAEELLGQIVEEGISRAELESLEAPTLESDEGIARMQKSAFQKLFEKLDQIPKPEPDGECASIDHDKFIYRRDW